MIHHHDDHLTVHVGDCREVLRSLDAESVHCVVTSPPYYGQREYQSEIEIGRESTPQEYVESLVRVFREARRVLKSTGTLWLVLGDKYHRGRLLGMPWRVSLALADDGWILRRDIVWHKPNAMPSAVKNRPTVDHEGGAQERRADRTGTA